MNTFLYFSFIALTVFLLIFIVWGLASKRQSLPCPVWLSWMVELDNPFTKTNRAEVIIQNLDLQPGMSALDFGCGPGRLTIPMAEKVGVQGRMTAVDMQDGMLKRTQEKAQSKNIENIRFVQSAAGEGKLGNDQFDRAVLVTVLGEIPDQLSALQELFNAIKPGGVLSITEIIFDPHFQSRSKVMQLAEKVGFQQRDFFGNKLAYTLNLEKPRTA
jgi:ubiquinone/menaquinone biosynthesis C-methylase UbiE